MNVGLIGCFASALALAGCLSAEDLRKRTALPAPERHSTEKIRKQVALSALRVGGFSPQTVLENVKAPKFSAFHVEATSSGGKAYTEFCIDEPLGTPSGIITYVKHFKVKVTLFEEADGTLTVLSARNNNCFKEPNQPFPELLEMSRAVIDYEKRRPAPSIPENNR